MRHTQGISPSLPQLLLSLGVFAFFLITLPVRAAVIQTIHGAINRFDPQGSGQPAYEFTAQTTDPEGDPLYYIFSWGDGTETRVPSLAATSPSDPWWNANWLRRKKITFDNSAQASDLDNFPVMVKLYDTGNPATSRIQYNSVQDSGQDIRFVDADNSTVLAYEIESWNTIDDSYLWVKVPRISSASTTDHIWVYYGNASAQDCETDTACPNASTVWSNGYAGVWHLSETSGRHYDSTINNNDSDLVNNPSDDVPLNIGSLVSAQGSAAGAVSGADQFDGLDDRITIPDHSSLDFANGQAFTIEAWVKTTALTGFIANKKDPGTASPGGYQLAMEGGGQVTARIGDGTNQNSFTCATAINNDLWHHLSLTYTTTDNAIIYLDGNNCASQQNTSVGNLANAQSFVIAEEGDYNSGTPGGWFINGFIDEVRVSNTNRAAPWNAAQYKSMNDTLISSVSSEDVNPTVVTSGTAVSAKHTWTTSGDYSVYVIAYDTSDLSSPQSDIIVTSIQSPSTPGKPTMKTGANPTATGIFTLDWSPSDPHSLTSVPVIISQYDIWRQFDDGTGWSAWQKIGLTVGPSDPLLRPVYSESGLPDGDYRYRIVALDDTVCASGCPNISLESEISDVITVDSTLGGDAPTANFRWCLLSAVSRTIQFEDLSIDSEGPVEGWEWDFDDGTVCPPDTTCDDQHPFHTFPPSTMTGWWNAQWDWRSKITFDNSAHNEDLVNFPVLVTLTPSRIDYTKTNVTDGRNLRFVDDSTADCELANTDGAYCLLDYEIEKWNYNGTSYIWVEVPRINASANNDFIWMYYGNTSASSGWDIAGTWDSNYKGVWHLDESPNDNNAGHADSTASNNAGTPRNYQDGDGGTTNATGIIDGANRPAPQDDYVTTTATGSTQNLGQEFTIETWFKRDRSGAFSEALVTKRYGNYYSYKLSLSSNVLRFDILDAALNPQNVESLTPITDTTNWHYAVARSDGTNLRIFQDGSITPQSTTKTYNPSYDTNVLYIGTGIWNTTLNDYFDGFIDEIRISSTARSNTWIAAQYKSMTDAFFNLAQSFTPEQYAPTNAGPYDVTLTAYDSAGLPSVPLTQTVDISTATPCASLFINDAASADTCTKIGLSWYPAYAASGYSIFRSDNGAPWSVTPLFTNISPYTNTFYDTTVLPQQNYQYYVQADIPAGTLNASSPPSCTGTWSGDTPPQTFCPFPVVNSGICPPIIDTLSPESPCDSITITWQAALGATGYQVWRATTDDFGAASKIAAGLSDTTFSYVDTDVVPDVTYYYFVTDQTDTNHSDSTFTKSICFRGSRWQER